MRNAFLFLAATLTLSTAAKAQQAYFRVTFENMGTAYGHRASGAFAVPEGSADPAPIGPGADH